MSWRNEPKEGKRIKRTIAGVLLLVAFGAGSLFADDGYWSARRHIERDRQKIAEDRRELQRDLYYGDYRAVTTSAGSLSADIATCNGIWIASTIAMDTEIATVIGIVTTMAVIMGNGGRM